MKTCSQEKNANSCNCSYPCSRKGICCECITYHRRMGELPACYFPTDIESSYDRSVEKFLRVVKARGNGYLRAL